MLRKIKNIVLVICTFFLLQNNILGLTYGGCEYSEISTLKSYLSNLNFSYDYYTVDEQIYFSVTINNIVPGMYFVDSRTDKVYNYSDSIDGEIIISGYKGTSGNYKFYSSLNDCPGVKLGVKYYKFPSYNKYYKDPLCEANANYSLCQKWADVKYSYSEFEKLINDYNKKKNEIVENQENEIIYEQTFFDAFVKFYIDYYYFILIGIIVICITAMIISKKKNSFDL